MCVCVSDHRFSEFADTCCNCHDKQDCHYFKHKRVNQDQNASPPRYKVKCTQIVRHSFVIAIRFGRRKWLVASLFSHQRRCAASHLMRSIAARARDPSRLPIEDINFFFLKNI